MPFSSYIEQNQKNKDMLELSKKILQKVSFDRILFQKELRKSLNWVKPNERVILKAWCLATFGAGYHEVIMEVFESTMGASL
jgi:hypothetical protein